MGRGDTHTIELRDFSVVYPAFTLQPLSLGFRDGERVALVGPNGAGKSTTLNAMAGRLPQYRGEIRVDGADLRALLPWVRARIGFLPESLLGYGWMTIQQHLDFLAAFYPGWDRQYAATLLQRLDLPPAAKLGTLSKGMRVKLSFIAAEAYRPPFLLLDEPTSGLDPVVRRELIDVILERVPRGAGRVVLFSTHILEDVEWIADRVVVLAGGRLRADVSVAELQRRGQNRPLSTILYAILSGDEPHAFQRTARA